MDVLPLGNIRAVRFCELATGAHAGLDMRGVCAVTNNIEIAQIIKGVAVGREVPVTKAIFRRIIFIDQHGTNESLMVSYYEPYYERAGIKQNTLRIGAREYETTRNTIVFLNSYYDQTNTTANADTNRVR